MRTLTTLLLLTFSCSPYPAGTDGGCEPFCGGDASISCTPGEQFCQSGAAWSCTASGTDAVMADRCTRGAGKVNAHGEAVKAMGTCAPSCSDGGLAVAPDNSSGDVQCCYYP